MAEVTLKYVVLRHSDIAAPHFDLLLETYPGSELATWRASVWPIAGTVTFKRLKDHRRLYLDFEGELTQRRGKVERVAEGQCRLEIGENSVWTIRFSDSTVGLVLKLVNDDEWNASTV